MLVNGVMDFARTITHTTTGQFSNATMIDWVNIIYRDLVRSIITELGENNFTATVTQDAVAAQDSYTLASTFIKMKEVKIKPTSTATDWVPTREVDFSKMAYDIDWYLTNWSADDPLHQVIGGALYIAPRFVTATTGSAPNNQIRYKHEARQIALLTGGAESTILIPVDYHHVISIGLKQYIYSGLGKIKEKDNAIAEYKMVKDDMLYQMTDQDDTDNAASMPDDQALQ